VKIRRVLVALDARAPSRGALAAAAAIARGATAELSGLFVEDEDLHRIAALPIARVVGYPSAAPRAIGVEEMRFALRGAADRAAADLSAAAARHEVRFTFRVARGRVAAEIAAASRDADLVLLGKSAPPASFTRVAASAARAVADRAGRPVMVVGEGRALGPPAVVYDGTPSGERALVTAAFVAREARAPVVVLAIGSDLPAAERAGREGVAWLAAQGLEARARVVPVPTTSAVLRALLAAGAGTLVVDGGWPRDAAEMDHLLEEAPVPVMIAR
jgi:nucleotide-binding universal stress UspA family protein